MEKKVMLQKSWIWNGSVQEFIKSKVVGKTLNVCAGLSEIGDVKIDLDPKRKDVQLGDMRKLPFPDNFFDTVISDPPWKIGFYKRMKPFFECVRVCKVGGRIIYNAYWVPTSKIVKLEEVVVRQDTAWANTSIISIFKKTVKGAKPLNNT